MQNRKYPLETVAAWFQALDVDFVTAAQAAGADITKLIQAFRDCKAQAKANFRKLAFELHPDRQGGDGARFKELTDVWDRLKSVEISPRSSPPRQVVRTTIVIRYQPRAYANGYNKYTNGTTTTSGPWW